MNRWEIFIFCKKLFWRQNNLETADFLEKGSNDFDAFFSESSAHYCLSETENRLSQKKLVFEKMAEMDDFWQFFAKISRTRIFFENRALSVLSPCDALTSCKTSKDWCGPSLNFIKKTKKQGTYEHRSIET